MFYAGDPDHDGNDMVPGALYVAAVADPVGRPLYGERVYFTGKGLVTESGANADEIEYDFLIRQGKTVNPAMIRR